MQCDGMLRPGMRGHGPFTHQLTGETEQHPPSAGIGEYRDRITRGVLEARASLVLPGTLADASELAFQAAIRPVNPDGYWLAIGYHVAAIVGKSGLSSLDQLDSRIIGSTTEFGDHARDACAWGLGREGEGQ